MSLRLHHRYGILASLAHIVASAACSYRLCCHGLLLKLLVRTNAGCYLVDQGWNVLEVRKLMSGKAV